MLRRKFFKILSVLVAMIIAFSCFVLPCSAVTVSGIKNLGNISLSSITLTLEWYDESNSRHYHSASKLTAEGFNGDGSLRLHCDVGTLSSSTTHIHYTVPAGSKVILNLQWSGSEDDIYFSFPSFFSPHPSFSSVVGSVGALQGLCNPTRNTFSSGVFHILSGSNCIQYHSKHSITCTFLPEISFSQFDLNISLSDPTVVPPIEVFFNDLGQFFDYSAGNISSSFNNIILNSPLLIIVFALSIVGFAYGLLYRFIKGY